MKLKTAAQKIKDRLAAWAAHIESYEYKRTMWNAQRCHKHPARQSAAKRRKLRRN